MTPDEAAQTAIAQALAIDACVGEVVSALRQRGISSVLIKGATVAEWLYPGEVRPYGDADLLVSPADVQETVTVLEELGFVPGTEHISPHAQPWVRQDGGVVDLHVRLFGLRCDPARAWRELQRWTETTRIAGTPVTVLVPPARALQVVLHAVQHLDQPKPREDLRRALSLVPLEEWRATERLASELEALHIVAHGLALEPAGGALIDRLPLVRAAWLSDRVHAPLAVGLARYSEARGVRAKLRVLRRELALPDPELTPEAGRLPSGGSARGRAWLRHLSILLTRAPRTIWALRRRPSARSPDDA